VLFASKSIVPVVPVGDVLISELFHGPTLAFKDFGYIHKQFILNFFVILCVYSTFPGMRL
jgi:threonine synthase